MIFKSDENQGDLNGFLDAGSHMEGELRFEDTFRIDGRLTGKISSEGYLVVGTGGRIEGEIRVDRVYVSGVVKGSILAADRVEIGPEGKVYAEIQTSSLVIEEGAFFEGQCTMVKKGEGAKTTPKLVQPVQMGKKSPAAGQQGQ